MEKDTRIQLQKRRYIMPDIFQNISGAVEADKKTPRYDGAGIDRYRG